MQSDGTDNIHIRLAVPSNINEVLTFFEDNLDIDSDCIYSQEFICTDGIKAAIRRNQLLVAISDGHIVGALRFYKKKTDNSISLYQFAICKNHRNQGLVKQMLSTIKTGPVRVKCPKHSSMNNYFQRTGWSFQETKGELNGWQLY